MSEIRFTSMLPALLLVFMAHAGCPKSGGDGPGSEANLDADAENESVVAISLQGRSEEEPTTITRHVLGWLDPGNGRFNPTLTLRRQRDLDGSRKHQGRPC